MITAALLQVISTIPPYYYTLLAPFVLVLYKNLTPGDTSVKKWKWKRYGAREQAGEQTAFQITLMRWLFTVPR